MGAENHPKDTVCCNGRDCLCGSNFLVKNLETNGGDRTCSNTQCPHQTERTKGAIRVALAGKVPFPMNL